ncbi:hypothetical protein RF11_07599 [Thelohanellus kitauei]|uniref:Uncharacterized protein n=1 Tax=Thelohanellus kitauei TaxID=669202 RepID=A0A0C2N3B1_THEKT|nr:hypothetical protein RF11_07599 [Thelohanellus kitauei]
MSYNQQTSNINLSPTITNLHLNGIGEISATNIPSHEEDRQNYCIHLIEFTVVRSNKCFRTFNRMRQKLECSFLILKTRQMHFFSDYSIPTYTISTVKLCMCSNNFTPRI